MEQQDFIVKITEVFSEDFTPKNLIARMEAYKIALEGKEVDYDKLFKRVLEKYESFRFAPPPSFICKMIEELKKEYIDYSDPMFHNSRL